MTSMTSLYDGPPPQVGVIGGSGLYSLLESACAAEVQTPGGSPSGAVTIGDVAGRTVAFLPRHGRDHGFPPHRVNYRANVWALRRLRVRQIRGRDSTFYDEAGSVVHVGFADPYCGTGRGAVAAAAACRDVAAVDGGTLVVVNVPRFSSRAESLWHQAQGWSLVGMTAMPEAALARELGLCYTDIALVTDLDAGLEHGDGVTHDQVLEVFAANVEVVRSLLFDAIAALPAAADGCSCGHALDGLKLPFDLP